MRKVEFQVVRDSLGTDLEQEFRSSNSLCSWPYGMFFKENKTINNSDDNDYNSNHFSSDYYVLGTWLCLVLTIPLLTKSHL